MKAPGWSVLESCLWLVATHAAVLCRRRATTHTTALRSRWRVRSSGARASAHRLARVESSPPSRRCARWTPRVRVGRRAKEEGIHGL